jgi:DNA-binding CsgD family transcriptional regulator
MMNAPGAGLETFSGLLLALYRAAREVPAQEFQDVVLLLLKPLLKFDSSMWGSGHAANGGIVVHSIHLHEQPAQMVADWQLVNHQATVVREVVKRPGWAMNVHVPTLYREKDKAVMRDFASRYHMACGLVIAYKQRDMPLVNWIALYRKDAELHYSEHQRALFEALAPHVAEALTISRQVHLDRLYLTHPAGRASLAIADRLGVIHYSDGGFDDLIRAEWPGRSSRVLPQRVVDALNGSDVQSFRGTHTGIAIRWLGDLCFLKARALTAMDALSLRQRQIARHFGAGSSYKEIARTLGISPATVRNHLQAVYEKLGIRDKAALAHLFPVPPVGAVPQD